MEICQLKGRCPCFLEKKRQKVPGLDFCASHEYTFNMSGQIQNILSGCDGFDWDEGNAKKNWLKHKVTPAECEQIYFNQPLVIKDDVLHSETEKRFLALGKTDRKRSLFIAFTLRNNLIRVISARDMSRKEKEVYERL